MQFSVVVAHYRQRRPTLAITSRYNRDVLFQDLTTKSCRPVSGQAECFIRCNLIPPVETICKVAQKRSHFIFHLGQLVSVELEPVESVVLF